MRPLLAALLLLAALASSAQAQFLSPLAKARTGFATSVHAQLSNHHPPATPPEGVLDLVHYDSPAGALAAYATPDPKDGRRHPAIVWIHGGGGNGIGELAWKPAPRENDQSASAYRQAGIAMMFPSLRGGNDDPGTQEAFYGEVTDVLAAADWLAKQPWVDPTRIYLAGHSTGGTLALLTSEISPRFRAVIAFGPVSTPATYDAKFLGVDLRKLADQRELALRSPILWLQGVHSRTIVLEGSEQGNLGPLLEMKAKNTNPQILFVPVEGASHVSILAPANELFARKILQDTGPASDLAITADEITATLHREVP